MLGLYPKIRGKTYSVGSDSWTTEIPQFTGSTKVGVSSVYLKTEKSNYSKWSDFETFS